MSWFKRFTVELAFFIQKGILESVQSVDWLMDNVEHFVKYNVIPHKTENVMSLFCAISDGQK